MKCPCCSNKSFDTCCQPFISGKKLPQTPKQLMRSRYSAYTLADIDYIRATMQGKAAEGFDPTAAKQWAQSCEWLGLQVLKTETDGSNGTVELVATFKQNGQLQTMHERSKFLNVLGKWFYIDAYPG